MHFFSGVKCPTDSRKRPDQRLLENGQVWSILYYIDSVV